MDKSVSLLSYLEEKSKKYEEEYREKLIQKERDIQVKEQLEEQMNEKKNREKEKKTQLNELQKEIASLKEELTKLTLEKITEMALKNLSFEEAKSVLGEKKKYLDELEKKRINMEREIEELKREREGLKSSLAQVKKSLDESKEIENVYKKVIEAITKRGNDENNYRVETFDRVMQSLVNLCLGYEKELKYDIEVELDAMEQIYFKNLSLSYEETGELKKLSFDTIVITEKKEEDYYKGCYMDTYYHLRPAFNLESAKEVYDFFYFLPRTFIHPEFTCCLSEEKMFLTALFIYQPDNELGESFVKIATSEQLVQDIESDVKHEVYFAFSEYPTSRV